MTSRRAFLQTLGPPPWPAAPPPAPPCPRRTARHGGRPGPPPARRRLSRAGRDDAHRGAHRRGRHGRPLGGVEARQSGLDDFLLVELENEPGGNARSGASPLVAYPWGAPPAAARPGSPGDAGTPGRTGVLAGDPAAEKPGYDERYLCATPQERVFKDGLWEEDSSPLRPCPRRTGAAAPLSRPHGGTPRPPRGKDGRRAFALPMELSSRDPAWLALDRLPFSRWLNDNGFTAPRCTGSPTTPAATITAPATTAPRPGPASITSPAATARPPMPSATPYSPLPTATAGWPRPWPGESANACGPAPPPGR